MKMLIALSYFLMSDFQFAAKKIYIFETIYYTTDDVYE